MSVKSVIPYLYYLRTLLLLPPCKSQKARAREEENNGDKESPTSPTSPLDEAGCGGDPLPDRQLFPRINHLASAADLPLAVPDIGGIAHGDVAGGFEPMRDLPRVAALG